MQLILKQIKIIEPEAVIWIAGLIILAFINPYGGSHFSICPLHNLGFKYCPGCGLGHSISFLLHGDFYHSVECHILGIPAIIVLVFRIKYLLMNSLKKSVIK